MKEVRAQISAHPSLAAGLNESLQPVLDLLDSRFKQLQLKGRHFKTGHVALEAEVEDIFDEIRLNVDPALQMSQLTQDDLRKSEPLQKFMKEHCHFTKYAFQVRKCLLDSCTYCSSHPIRMSVEEFEVINLLPMTKSHYKPFAEVYGSTPNEKDRPSKQPVKCSESEEVDKTNKKLLSQSGKVRAILRCGDCSKPRCLFSETALSTAEKSMITDLEPDFTCGSMLFPPASQYHSSIVVRVNLSCVDNIEPQYYSATLVKFPPVCCRCGAPEETLFEDELVRDLKQRKQVVRPICFLCRSEGSVSHQLSTISIIDHHIRNKYTL